MKNINFKKGKWDIFLNIIKQKKRILQIKKKNAIKKLKSFKLFFFIFREI